MIVEAIQKLVEGNALSADEAAAVMNEIMDGEATPAQFSAFVTALRMKGETPAELAALVGVMRERCLRVEIDGPLLDTCGTGGDHSGTFNVSTAAAFVVAGAGVRVAKHGNRAASGSTGSADALEALGVNIDLSPESVVTCIREVGFGFMFAQRYHPSMRFAAAPRREIGIRTVFNLLGPLTNPANAGYRLLGVSDYGLGPTMAEALALSGSERALVVRGSDGMDELTIAGPSTVWDLSDGEVSEYEVTPEDLGLSRSSTDDIRVDSSGESAEIIRDVLGGAMGPARDIVLMNAGAALAAAGASDTVRDGVEDAAESIDSGAAHGRLAALAELSRTLT